MAMIEYRVAYSARNFQSHSFLMSRISKRRIANGTESNGLNLFSRIKGITEQGLGNLFITSRSFHFFQTDLEHSSSISLNQTDHWANSLKICFVLYTSMRLLI